MSEETTTALARFTQAQESVNNLDANLPDAEITQAYAVRRDALSKLIQWDECDNVANAIQRLMLAQQSIQDLYDGGWLYRGDGVPDEEFEAAYAERRKAISQLMTASEQPSVTWPPSPDE
jgi:hypothetical protein